LAADVYERNGYKGGVRRVEGFETIMMLDGALRCITLVGDRGPYREATVA
jgi:hypothetical protein